MRRWQIGEAAQCACPAWTAPGACVVVSGGRRDPTVEREGEAHVCPTATPELGRPGRLRIPRLPRIDPAVVRAVEERAQLTGRPPAVIVEYVLRRWLDGRNEASAITLASLAVHDQEEADAARDGGAS